VSNNQSSASIVSGADAKGSDLVFRKSAYETLMSTHASVLVDSVGPPSAEVCRVAASFP
jgi:hypothetical protein